MTRQFLMTLVAMIILAGLVFSQAMSTITWTALSAAGVTSSLATAGNDKHTLAAVIAGSPATCTMRLEGSLDNVNFFDLSGSQTCTSTFMFHVVDRTVTFVRGRVLTLTGGSTPTVTITYLGIRTGGK